jgi:hypothetical protein
VILAAHQHRLQCQIILMETLALLAISRLQPENELSRHDEPQKPKRSAFHMHLPSKSEMEMLDMFEGLTIRDAVIKSILNDERWYGDGSPQWTISAKKPWQRPSQMAAQAREQHDKTERLLDRHGSNDPYASHLIKSIERCHPNRHCGSGACPECQRALQRWFVENVHDAAAALLKDKRKLILVSIVPDYAATDATRPNLNWENVIAKLCEDMASVGIPWAIGGSDFSVNIDKVNGGDPVLQGQFWMLIEKPKGNWSDDLKALINSSGKIKKPLFKRKYASSHAQLAYAIKNEFNKRETYIKRTKLRNPHMNTRKKSFVAIFG